VPQPPSHPAQLVISGGAGPDPDRRPTAAADQVGDAPPEGVVDVDHGAADNVGVSHEQARLDLRVSLHRPMTAEMLPRQVGQHGNLWEHPVAGFELVARDLTDHGVEHAVDDRRQRNPELRVAGQRRADPAGRQGGRDQAAGR
jgi:hypothetical protein